MSMKFYAIAYKYQEDVFYNFEKEDTTLDSISPAMLLPTEQMAEEYIEDQLSDDFVAVDVTIVSYRNGITQYEIGKVEQWDEVF